MARDLFKGQRLPAVRQCLAFSSSGEFTYLDHRIRLGIPYAGARSKKGNPMMRSRWALCGRSVSTPISFLFIGAGGSPFARSAHRIQANSLLKSRFFPSVRVVLRHALATFLTTSAWVG